jgi:hypothetical protein
MIAVGDEGAANLPCGDDGVDGVAELVDELTWSSACNEPKRHTITHLRLRKKYVLFAKKPSRCI